MKSTTFSKKRPLFLLLFTKIRLLYIIKTILNNKFNVLEELFMKRIFSMLMTITMLMCAVGFAPISAQAEIVNSGECGADGGNLTWTLDDEGTLTISGTGDMADYTIVENDLSLYTTAPWYTESNWYDKEFDIKRVIIEDGATSIGKCAFALCYGLESADIPSSVKAIGNNAFYYCIGLTDVNIPNSVTTIGSFAFEYCYSLTYIFIPESVTSIASASFYSCYNLTGIEVDENNKNYTSEDGVLFNKDKTTLIQCPAGKADAPYAIPDSVIAIDDYAFAHGHLTQVTIPDSVISIGASTFFFNKSIKSITIPGSVKTISRSAFWGCTALTDAIICDGVETIEDSAFHECRALTKITIPDSVTAIGDYAFSCCSALESVTIPDSVISLGNYAFYLCDGLKSAVIGKGVTSLEHGTFQSCKALTSVTIPESVTNIDMYVFYRCDSLTDVYYGGSEEDWNNIDINEYANECLLNAEIHYNSPPAEDITVISTAEELKAFADSVNNGNTYEGKTVTLTADIDLSSVCGATMGETDMTISWTPIGTFDNPFNGTFDGNGHTISGLYIHSGHSNGAGLFGWCDESSQVLNLVVDGSVTVGYPSLDGWANPPSIISGIVGFSLGKIANCHNKAAITGIGNGAYAAGICGSGPCVIENCINTGVIVSEHNSEAIVAFGSGNGNDNCYYLEGTSIDGSGAEAKTTEQFASGEVAYLLGDPWGQKIGVDAYPIIGGDKVYFVDGKYTNTITPPKKVVTVEPPTVNLESGEVPYGSKITISPTNGNDFEYSVNGEQFVNSRLMNGLGDAVITITEDTVLVVRSMIDVVEPDTEYIFPEVTYTYTIGGCVVPAIYPYTINSLKPVSENGEEYDTPPTDKSFIVDVDITKNSERDSKDYFIVAVYDTDDALISMNYIKANLPTGSDFSCGVNIPRTDKTIGSIKAFVWDALGGMTPLAEGKTIECSAPALME